MHTIESAINREPYIRTMVRDTGVILHAREDIIRNCILNEE